jgi:hypothetical protein
MTHKQIAKKLETLRKRVADDRDKLGDFLSEIQGLEETCTRAHDSLVDAIDALSEQA